MICDASGSLKSQENAQFHGSVWPGVIWQESIAAIWYEWMAVGSPGIHPDFEALRRAMIPIIVSVGGFYGYPGELMFIL